ncbi:class I SAM-dependent methyltransferase [Pseudoalteromonas rubra]|uniref:Class I SAM-dependent methyltransferase n=1 Tax=Pseudoalteromonas rubra TaxID=43658 RepID=A0A4V2E410_9GAMM|nr:class I SAM-dependent methyltransferase [Pseudoalteromonas rubra]RZM84383.1 class I SAM-dependent methyltransferase [Pseudoalteromonas rubra]
MPSFTQDEATHYDSRIERLVPGYQLLHELVQAQLQTLLPEQAQILIVGAGTGKEVLQLAESNPSWTFIVQDVSDDMLAIADQNFTNLGLSSRVTIHSGPLSPGQYQADIALCLLVMHFVADDGAKLALLESIHSNLKPGKQLLLADLMKPETQFERESQLKHCRAMGLTHIGEERMRHNLEHEFYPLDRMRLAELLDESGFSTAQMFFKALGFSGLACVRQ